MTSFTMTPEWYFSSLEPDLVKRSEIMRVLKLALHPRPLDTDTEHAKSIIIIHGPCGSGKSTLIRLLLRLVPSQHLNAVDVCKRIIYESNIHADLSGKTQLICVNSMRGDSTTRGIHGFPLLAELPTHYVQVYYPPPLRNDKHTIIKKFKPITSTPIFWFIMDSDTLTLTCDWHITCAARSVLHKENKKEPNSYMKFHYPNNYTSYYPIPRFYEQYIVTIKLTQTLKYEHAKPVWWNALGNIDFDAFRNYIENYKLENPTSDTLAGPSDPEPLITSNTQFDIRFPVHLT